MFVTGLSSKSFVERTSFIVFCFRCFDSLACAASVSAMSTVSSLHQCDHVGCNQEIAGLTLQTVPFLKHAPPAHADVHSLYWFSLQCLHKTITVACPLHSHCTPVMHVTSCYITGSDFHVQTCTFPLVTQSTFRPLGVKSHGGPKISKRPIFFCVFLFFLSFLPFLFFCFALGIKVKHCDPD